MTEIKPVPRELHDDFDCGDKWELGVRVVDKKQSFTSIEPVPRKFIEIDDEQEPR